MFTLCVDMIYFELLGMPNTSISEIQIVPRFFYVRMSTKLGTPTTPASEFVGKMLKFKF